MTESVLTMGQTTIACLWNNRNSKWQAMSSTPEERKEGRKIREYVTNISDTFLMLAKVG